MTEMTEASVARYSTLNDDWEVKGQSFTAPLVPERRAQTLLFGDRLRNGSVSADIEILESTSVQPSQKLAMEAALVVRHNGPEAFWYAGTGAYGGKFFIAKVSPGPVWTVRGTVGQSSSVLKGKIYRLRVEFSGSQITLYENDVQQLTVLDESYQVGQCGLRAWATSARFDNVRIAKAKPRAFLIMPFTSELNFVHKIIHHTVGRYGVDCVRADQVAVSRPVMDDVKRQIAEADLVIVDFTGKNPNVYYEAGLADASKKDWIVLAQSADDLAFDVQHIRCVHYSNTMGADQELQARLEGALEALGHKPEACDGT